MTARLGIPTEDVLPLGDMTPEVVTMIGQMVQAALQVERSRQRGMDESRTTEQARVEAEAQTAREAEMARLV